MTDYQPTRDGALALLKKWKQKAFAAGANREVIDKGAEMLGVDRGELISDVIAGMRQIAPDESAG